MARQREILDQNVYEATKERIRYLYSLFDKIVVSFSGGKDSTVALQLTLEVARELGKLPLKVVYFDEEIVHPPTIDYVERCYEMDDVDMDWVCVEIKHRNACSNESPFWYTWDSENKPLWVRDMPEFAISEHPKFERGMAIPDFCPHYFDRSEGRVCWITGIRTQESVRRLTVMSQKKNDNYITSEAESGTSTFRAHPIYDWSSVDVWVAVNHCGWDYNHTYDLLDQTRMHGSYLAQRVAPPFGEEPLKGLWLWNECFPELWHKMLDRVPGAATAWRYSNTELYRNAHKKPDHLTYRQYADVLIDQYDGKYQLDVRATVSEAIRNHQKKTKRAIPESTNHPLSGLSWKTICMIIQRGDFKGRQVGQLARHADTALKKLGLTLEEAKKKYG